MIASKTTLITALLLTAVAPLSAGEMAVFWASDPIRPGETAMAIGEGFGAQAVVETARLTDGPTGEPSEAPAAWPESWQRLAVAPATEQSLKFTLPAEWKPGIFAVRITKGNAAVVALLNVPQIWWTQGDLGIEASPGGWIRVFGKNLGSKVNGSVAPAARLVGAKTVTLTLSADGYTGKVTLPSDLPPGQYMLRIHSGRGGPSGWSKPVAVHVAMPHPWPQTVFNVKDSGAAGDGVKDDTAAVRAALAKARQNGGGQVVFPSGRYRLSGGLKVPRFTVLRGDDRQRTCLAWNDLPKPPDALVAGTNSFGIEELTLYAQNYRHVIVGDLGDKPGAGDVFLRGVRVRANVFRGHPTVEQVDARFREAQQLGTGGGDTVRLGGPNVEIVDCDLYGSGRALYLSRVRGGTVRNSTLANGRWGWYCISGSDGLCFEDNLLMGADLMSTGGGLNCLDGSMSSENVYFSHNRLRLMHGWDREAMTSDAGGDAYFGKIRSAHGTTLDLTAEPKWTGRNWAGALVCVLQGRGAGQYRRIVRHSGTTVELDRPWTVAPDAASELCITAFQGRYMILDNEFTDTGAMQFFGTSIECLAVGNRATRMQGFRGLGMWYEGFQPSWFCQFLGNEILEGNYYHVDSAADAVLEVASGTAPPYAGSMNRGSVIRDNHLNNHAQIRVTGQCRDVVVERNRIEDVDQGIFVSREARDVLAVNNTFHDVKYPVVDEQSSRKAAEERMRRFLERPDPVAHWTFDALEDGSFADGSGNGFLAVVEGGVGQADGVRGHAARFDGKGYLRVEEPAVFNAPDLTVSFWLKPAKLTGRQGLVVKRFTGAMTPLVITQGGAAISFEAGDVKGGWSFNFGSPPVLKANRWTHVAVAIRRGAGVVIYADGRQVAENKIALDRTMNDEPLILGREEWGGDSPKGNAPGIFTGLMDELKIWTRTLGADEIQAEYQRVRPAR
jgi:hypothetical protein